jgi:hypothetical protein
VPSFLRVHAGEIHKDGKRQGDEKQLNLKAIYITAQLKGPAFRGTHTDMVYEKLMQPR